MYVRQVGWRKASGWLGAWIVCLLCGCDRPVDGAPPHATESGPRAAQRLSKDIKDLSREPSLELRRNPSSGTEVDDFTSGLPELPAIATARGDEDSAAAGRPMRWAILGTPTVRDSGLSDLLLAQLSTLGGIELVEREALQAIAAEYSLAELGTAGAVHDRLHLGTLLRADRLLLLSRAVVEVDADDKQAAVFRMVIVDCQTGARIGREDHPAETDPQAFIDAAITAVGQTQVKFPNGVVRIVGVSPFLSKNLLHSYDHRQAGYAYLLQHALALHPGTAVLEVEEARAVAQELSLGAPSPDGADSFRRRTVPALVDGEFTVADDPTSGTQAVDLTVRVRRADDLDEIHKTALPPADVVSFLTGALPRRILALDEPQAPLLSHLEQRDWLVARAEKFARVGAWEYSLGLREAALLVAPDDVALRLKAVEEYGRWMIQPLAAPSGPDRVPSEREIRAAYRNRVRAFATRLAHLEFLIRNRMLTADRILATDPGRGWIHSCSTVPLARSIPRKLPTDSFEVMEARKIHSLYRRLADEEFRAAEEIEAAFMNDTFPLILSLARNDRDLVERWWVTHLLDFHLSRVRSRVPPAGTLDALYRVITEIVPPDAVVRSRLLHAVVELVAEDVSRQQKRMKWDQVKESEDGEVAAFLNRLAHSERPIAQVYGRWGLLQHRWLPWRERWVHVAGNPGRTKERSELSVAIIPIVEDARELLAFYESLDLPGSSTDTTVRPFVNRVEDTLAALTPAADPVGEHRRWTPYDQGEEDRLAQFEITGPIDMVIKTLAGNSKPVIDGHWHTLQARWNSNDRGLAGTDRYPIVGWRKCNQSLDVLWNQWAVLRMRKQGLAEEIFSEPQSNFLDVKWDGREFWILTKVDGLRSIAPSGQLVRRIGAAEGLPPYDQGIVFHPIKPGVVCVAGSFGQQQRGWCAIVDSHSDQPVRVIHEATAVRPPLDGGGEVDSIALAFTPTCVYEFKDQGSRQRMLMIGRRSGGIPAAPLTVGFETLDVALPSADSTACLLRRPTPILSPDFSIYIGKRRILQPTGSSTGRWLIEIARPSLEAEALPRRMLCERGGGYNTLLPLGRWIYVPSGRTYWYRIDRDTFEEQLVLMKSSADRFRIRHQTVFKISAHYGIVLAGGFGGSRSGPYRQVVIHEPPR